jgi:(E)-4-hydroxy-3-methylbut-2-enyl-diphosphate synthase
MVASAVEFADICRKHDFHNFVFSMKARVKDDEKDR